MTEQELIEEARRALERSFQRPSSERAQRLIDIGLIDEQGNVRNDVRVWDAFLAVVATDRRNSNDEITYYECLHPAFGFPGKVKTWISRDSLVSYIREGKRIITAYMDNGRWKEGDELQLTPDGFVRTDGTKSKRDDLGDLPMETRRSRL